MAHEELPIPIYSTLDPVYGEGSSLEEAQLRFDRLKSRFLELFGHEPDLYARSPGETIILFIIVVFRSRNVDGDVMLRYIRASISQGGLT